jgi:hypothetical protein
MADEYCRAEDCEHRHWRSGPMPTHRIGATCPPQPQHQSRVERVLALHKKDPHDYPTGHVCDHCEYKWPCPTVRLLTLR